MRVLLVSKACLVGAYQRKLEELAAFPDVDLTVAVPARWRDERGILHLERAHTQGYDLVIEPILFNGHYHLHFYPQLARRMRSVRPHIVHVDEEPYNLATWHALRLARRASARALFFSWQNIARRYPWPFAAMQASVLRQADYAICGNAAAAEVWHQKGYRGPIATIPQFGVDPDLYTWREPAPDPAYRFVVGYVGRLVPEKGVDLLLTAFARLPEHARLELVGAGPQQGSLQRMATKLSLGGRVRFTPWLPSAMMPARLKQLDVLVLPSRTQPNWKEQFGRVLVEAMACGVPVVGSTCGEIPHVIGEAGLVFPEGDADALADALRRLYDDAELVRDLAHRGRERVQENYTQAQIAAQTVAVYRRVMSKAPMV